MKTISVNIHSLIDLITNSSSEIFVNSTERTVAVLYQAVDAILKARGESVNSRTLFEIARYYKATNWDAVTAKHETRIVTDDMFEFDNNKFEQNVLIRVSPLLQGDEYLAAAQALEEICLTFDGVDIDQN